MKLSKAKELINNGTHFLIEDIENGIESKYLRKLSFINWNLKTEREPIYISEITEDEEEIVYQMQIANEWFDCNIPIRIKPKPDFSKELEALNKKAKDNNMKVIVTFENNL